MPQINTISLFMKYNEKRSLTIKETQDAVWGMLNILLMDAGLEDERDFQFEFNIENGLFRFSWSYIESIKTYNSKYEVHGAMLEVPEHNDQRHDDYFEYPFKDMEKIRNEIINTIDELSKLETL